MGEMCLCEFVLITGEEKMLLVCTGQRPGMLLDVLQCTGQPETKNYVPPNAYSAKTGNPALWTECQCSSKIHTLKPQLLMSRYLEGIKV